MINTELVIKRQAVSDASYNRDSDDASMYEDVNTRQRQIKRLKQRRKRLYDPKFFDNDSDFSSSDDEHEHDEKRQHISMKTNKNKKLLYGIKPKEHSFNKYNIKPPRQNGTNKSNLTKLIQSSAPVFNSHSYNRRGNGGGGHGDILQRNHSKYARYEPESEHMGGDINGHFPTFILTVYFSEYLKEEAIKLEINEPWTVNETIIKCITKWNVERPMHKLKSNLAQNYLMRGVETDMDEIEIEEDVPAFGKNLKINTLNEKFVGLQYIEFDARKYSAGGNKVMEFKNAKEQILVRVSIPGPNNESHVLAIDQDATALSLRDLISLLNKKKHGAHFHPQYFHFYFDDNDGMGRIIDLNNNINSKRKILSLAKCIIDLKEPRQLFLLPKFLGSNDDLNEAYNFNLVRLANETREYRCTKIRNARKNKKRLLIVNRHRIVKKAMDDYNIGTSDHVPIDIISIINLQIVDKDNKQFSIEYRKPQAGGIRQQIYEFDTEKECKHFVDKVKYLKTIRQLQGI